MLPPNVFSGILHSVQIGTPQSYGSERCRRRARQTVDDRVFQEARLKGPVFVGSTNLAGDGQADLRNHGGVDKAVLAYSANHYPKWRDELRLPGMPTGAFGENLTIAGLNEESVCIGDVFRIGPVLFEVSQPRQPCWKLARRWRMHELVGMVVQNGRTGWYFRVLEEGTIEARMPVLLVDRPNPAWTIARANEILHHHQTKLSLTLELRP